MMPFRSSLPFIRPALALLVGLTALLAPARTAAAQDQDEEPPPRLEAEGELAFVGNSGNASTSTFGLGGQLTSRPDAWVVSQRFSFVRNTSKGALTAESWLYAMRAEHRLGGRERLSAFGEYGFVRDQFAGFSGRHDLTAGLSWNALVTPSAGLRIDAGYGYLNERRLSGRSISSASYSTGSAGRWTLSPTAELTSEIRVTGTFDQADDWRLVNKAALTARLTTILSLKVAHIVRYVNVPAPGFQRTDTTASVALVAGFTRQGP